MKNKYLLKYTKHQNYSLFINDLKSDFFIIKLKGLKDIYDFLINRKDFSEKIGYLISNSRGFNTFFYNFNIDILFLDKNKVIIAILQNVSSNKITDYYENAFYCIILPRNSTDLLNVEIRNKIHFKKNYQNINL